MAENSNENIRVGIRVKPCDEKQEFAWYVNSGERELRVRTDLIPTTTTNTGLRRKVRKKMKIQEEFQGFDNVFNPSHTNQDVYEALAQNIVRSAMAGKNGKTGHYVVPLSLSLCGTDRYDATGTIFAYGQTASGKTHTMKGSPHDDLGVIQLALGDVFQNISQQNDRNFLLRISYLEIYNVSAFGTRPSNHRA